MGYGDIRTTMNIYAKAVPAGSSKQPPDSTPTSTRRARQLRDS